MPVVELDSCGRLTLPEEVRDRFGDRYHVVQLHNSVKLIPISDDPLVALRETFKDSDDSANQLLEGGRDFALIEPGREQTSEE